MVLPTASQPLWQQPENLHYFPIQQPMSEDLIGPADACFECRFFFKEKHYFFKKIFLMWTVLKIFIEFFYNIAFVLSFVFLAFRNVGS